MTFKEAMDFIDCQQRREFWAGVLFYVLFYGSAIIVGGGGALLLMNRWIVW